MSNQILVYLIGGVGALFGVIVVIYYMMTQKMNGKNTRYVAQLVEGTKKSSFSMDVFYQKFYVRVVRLPFIKRYAFITSFFNYGCYYNRSNFYIFVAFW